MLVMEAFVRAHFGVDPNTISTELFARLYNEAMYIEHWRLKAQAEMLCKIFGSSKK